MSIINVKKWFSKKYNISRNFFEGKIIRESNKAIALEFDKNYIKTLKSEGVDLTVYSFEIFGNFGIYNSKFYCGIWIPKSVITNMQ